LRQGAETRERGDVVRFVEFVQKKQKNGSNVISGGNEKAAQGEGKKKGKKKKGTPFERFGGDKGGVTS